MIMPLILNSIVTIDPTYAILFSSLWSICTVCLQISDLYRLLYGSLNIEEIQSIKLRSMWTILLNIDW